MPRAYRLGARQAAVNAVRARILAGTRELLEALFDDLARRGRLRENLRRAFNAADAGAGLMYFVAAFVTFFASERAVMRKLSGLSVLDPVFAEVSREGWRRRGARSILERLRAQTGKPSGGPPLEI